MIPNDNDLTKPAATSGDSESLNDDGPKIRAVVTASAEVWAVVDEARFKVSPSGSIDRGPFLLDFFLRTRQVAS